MINETDIAAFAPDLEIADRIVDRAKTGVPTGREMMADEVLPFIRAYVLMRDIAGRSATFMQELHDREMQGMSINRNE